MKPSAKFKKACKNQGLDAEKIMPDFSMYPERHRAALAALAELFIMADDANANEDNENWDPDFNNIREPKYRAWVDLEKSKSNPSGFRFGGADYVFTDATAYLGSRLSFRNDKITKEFFEKNKDHYKAIMTIPKTKKINNKSLNHN